MHLPSGLTYVTRTNHALDRSIERNVFLDRKYIDMDAYALIKIDNRDGGKPVLKYRQKVKRGERAIVLVMKKGNGNRYSLITTYYE